MFLQIYLQTSYNNIELRIYLKKKKGGLNFEREYSVKKTGA
jgi:hypothetical protein